jgi:hypothetical protein
MYRLGLRLTLRSGREAFIRLLVTMAAVAVGVTVLLVVLADFNAFQSANAKPAWQNSHAATTTASATSDQRTELWNYSLNVFEGRNIRQLDVAALGPHAPLPPGISRLPSAGQYYASPALAALLTSTPRDELGDRFPGAPAGTIGDQALTGPDDLVAYVGYSPAQLSGLPGTIRVDTLGSGPQTSLWTNYFRYAFAFGALAFLFPILVLIGMATRLAATRREERFAALRLVGATNRQLGVISSVDAVVGALLGTVLGFGLFALLRPTLAGAAFTGSRYFAYTVTPTARGYLSLLICVPTASAAASFVSLRRVRISPLGVSRKQTPPAPRARRIIPLALGIALFLEGLATTDQDSIGAGTYPGLLIILVGLVVGGPWLTGQAARLLAWSMRGAPSLLAARRLADNPRAAYRSVNGLVLAVFLGTTVAGLLPAINATSATPSATALNNVLLDQFTYSALCGNEVNCSGGRGPDLPDSSGSTDVAALGLPPRTGAALISRVRAFHGATVVPIYSKLQPADLSAALASGAGVGPVPNAADNHHLFYDSIVGCAALEQLAALGECAPGATAITADTSSLSNDNPANSTKPFADASNPTASADFGNLYLRALLVKVDDPATLEVVRTFLATHTPLSESGAAPRTFGEQVQARQHVGDIVQRIMNVAIVLTLLVAGCSLAVAVGGGLVERKRPFSILRLSGTPTSVLYKVVLLEATLPLAAATLVAAVAGYGVAASAAVTMGQPGTPVPTLGPGYFLTMGAGLAVSLAVIVATLPFLGRVTRPETARFE